MVVTTTVPSVGGTVGVEGACGGAPEPTAAGMTSVAGATVAYCALPPDLASMRDGEAGDEDRMAVPTMAIVAAADLAPAGAVAAAAEVEPIPCGDCGDGADGVVEGGATGWLGLGARGAACSPPPMAAAPSQ